MLVLLASMHCFAQTNPILLADVVNGGQIKDGDKHDYHSSLTDEVRVVVENLERGTVLKVCNIDCDVEENLLLRTVTWRGPEHFHSAIFTNGPDTVIRIEPDAAIGPPGSYQITLTPISADTPGYAGELAMTQGASLHADFWWDGADSLAAALAQFRLAAAIFDAEGNRDRLADAYFEEAAVHYDLNNFNEAYLKLIEAESIWIERGESAGLYNARNLRGLIHLHFADELTLDRSETAVQLFEEVRENRDPINERYFYGQAANNLGLAHQALGDNDLSLSYYKQALSAFSGTLNLFELDSDTFEFSELDSPPWLEDALTTLKNMGLVYDRVGNTAEALNHFDPALKLSVHLDTDRLSAEIRTNLGGHYYKDGQLDPALAELQLALAYFRDVSRDEDWLAQAQNNLGLVHYASGRVERAKAAFQASLNNRDAERDPVGRAETLRNMAVLLFETGDVAAAIQAIDSAFMLLPAEGNVEKVERAKLHGTAGRVYLAAGHVDKALSHHASAVDLSRGEAGYAESRAHRGWALHVANRGERAIREIEVALDNTNRTASMPAQFAGQTYLGRIYLARGEYALASAHAADAIDTSNQLRNLLRHPGLLRDFTATQQDAYDVLIHASIAQGEFEKAWEYADRSKARRFGELVRQSGAETRSLGLDEQLHLNELNSRIATLAELRTEALARSMQQVAAELRQELIPLLVEQERMRNSVVRPTAYANTGIPLNDIKGRLGPTDVMLEYYFGALSSGVWLIRADSFKYHPLQNVDAADALVKRIRESFKGLRPVSPADVRELSAIVLNDGKLALDDVENLIIVPDGSLHMISFSMLLDPYADYSAPLVASRKISYLPSASSLVDLQQRKGPPGDGLAVIADPVFEFSDERLANRQEIVDPQVIARLDPNATRSPYYDGETGFSRLRFTELESEAIRESAVDINLLVANGTDANRDLVLNGSLNGYRYLHFATHGNLDMEEPALSGLVLSGVSHDLKPLHRLLKTEDIISLQLQAELVVLSGCDTGIGKPVRGEGLQSLSRAFFYAGAEKVVSSLWSVPDESTAALMGAFYHEMLVNKLSPAEALRFAQLQVMSNEQWRDPYYWAAFVLQGDWT